MADPGERDVVEVYEDQAGEGRWRRVAPNGETLSSGEGFSGLWEARRAALRANLDLRSDRIVNVVEEPKTAARRVRHKPTTRRRA